MDLFQVSVGTRQCKEGACCSSRSKVRVSFKKFRRFTRCLQAYQDVRKAPLAAVGLLALRHPPRVPAHQLVVHGNEPKHATRECERLRTTSNRSLKQAGSQANHVFAHLPHNADERGRARGCLTERPQPLPVLSIIRVPGSEHSVCGIHGRRCHSAQRPRLERPPRHILAKYCTNSEQRNTRTSLINLSCDLPFDCSELSCFF